MILVYARCFVAALIINCGCGSGGGTPADVTAPQISAITITPGLVVHGSNAQIQATIMDAGSGVSTVKALITLPDTTTTTVTLAKGSADVYSATFKAEWNTGAQAEPKMVIQIEAKDVANNTAQSAESQVHTALAPPPAPVL